MKRLLLTTLWFVFFGGALLAQQYNGNSNVYRYEARSLTPVNTGRSASFSIQMGNEKSFALKTNLAYWATMTPNLGFEFGLGDRTSLEIAGGFNPWNQTPEPPFEVGEEPEKRMWHWSVKPEFRYWLNERFGGHYFGLHGIYSQYEWGGYKLPSVFDKEWYYEGNAYGGGLSYGYHLNLSRSWAIEFQAGVGVLWLDYDKRPCDDCFDEVQRFKVTYFGPTNVGIKMVFKM